MLKYVISLLFLVLVLLAPHANGEMIGLSTATLVKNSDAVIMGEVQDIEAFWSKDGKAIISRATVLVSSVSKGTVPEKTVIVEYEGGEIGDIGFKVSDVSPMNQGDRVVLFLKHGKSRIDGVVHTIVGMAQGKYTVGKDGIARKSGYSVVNGKKLIDNNISVDELLLRIEKVE